MNTPLKYAPIDTVSHDTTRNEDLLSRFASELRYAMTHYIWQGMTDQTEAFGNFNFLIAEAESIDAESEAANDTVHALFDALDSFSPPYTYFGANENYGSDYGWWPLCDSESLEDARKSGYRVEISDHGNVSLYDSADQEIWGLV